MRCRSCNYTLWRLTTRTCPECGAPFKPSEFEFEPNAVRFRCPHCAQDYYGTDPQGLLTPREFDCVRCQKHIHIDEMVLEPAAGLTDDQTRYPNPWLERRRIGRVRAWFQTIGMSMTRPGDLIRATPPGRGFQALWFAMICNFVFSALGSGVLIFLPFIFVLLGAGGAAGGGANATGAVLAGLSTFLIGILMLVVGGAIGVCIVIGLWTLVAHAVLRLSGPIEGDINTTATCLCYASGANVLSAIPCIGGYVAMISWIWTAVSATLMLKEAHRVSGLRAALAALAPPVAIVALSIGVFFWVIAGMMGPLRAARGSAMGASAAASVHTSVMVHPDGDGAWLHAHAATLVSDGYLDVDELVPYSGIARSFEPVIGEFSLSDLASGASTMDARRLAALAAFVAAVPDDAPAYRLGDIVFVRPPPEGANGVDWAAIIIPEGGTTNPWESIVVLLGSGATLSYDTTEFEEALDAENLSRVVAQMAPIPDPAQIPHEQRGWRPPQRPKSPAPGAGAGQGP